MDQRPIGRYDDCMDDLFSERAVRDQTLIRADVEQLLARSSPALLID